MDNFVPLPPARSAAIHRERGRLARLYPGHDVAYLEEWDGDELNCRVLFATRDLGEFVAQQRALPPEVFELMMVAYFDDSDPDELFYPRLEFGPPAEG